MTRKKILQNLVQNISGNVLWDKAILNYYSLDSSLYRILPFCIVIPKNETDIFNTIKIAKKFKISITARGSGTGLVGNSLNEGIILDLKNFNSIAISKNYVKIGPGTLKGNLDLELKKMGKFFPPNPSIGGFCSVGGMIANNASGSRSLKYGSMIDNVKEITFVTSECKKIILPKNKIFGKKILYLANKLEKNRFPKVSKNSSGYRLDTITSLKNTQKVLVGSEGTLGIILSAKLTLKPIPNRKILFIIEHGSEIGACLDCLGILSTKPSALEFIDKTIMEFIDYKFSKAANCLLFVEYDSNLNSNEKKIKKITTGFVIKTIKKNTEVSKWWRYRDSSLYYSLKLIKPNQRIPHLIEDATVPVENLPSLFSLLKKINLKFYTKSITYGHIGNGNIHVRIFFDRKRIKDLNKIANFYFKNIIKLGGTITGEHGDGLARTGFIKKQYGEKNYRVFKELKIKFDPINIFNPGKIISNKRIALRKSLFYS